MGIKLGGLARRAGFILDERKKDQAMILVDSGDYFFRDISMLGLEAHQLKKKAEILADAAKAFGYDVVVPGEADLATGLGGYKDLVKAAGVHPICANLQVGNQRVFDATAVRDVGGVKIGFTGVLQTNRPLPQEGSAPVVLADIEPALKAAVEELKGKKCDLIVAITHIGFEFDREIAKKVPGIDIIIGGHSRESLGIGSVYEHTTIYQSGMQGKYFGHVHVTVSDPGPDGKRTLVKQSGELHEMGPSRPENAEWAKVIKDYHVWVDEQNKNKKVDPKDVQANTGDDIYWGAELCGQCHLKQDKWWKSTVHSHAYETLVKVNKQNDVECLACHTTAFAQTRTRPGVKSLTDVTGLESVQCESCHAAGSRHNAPEIRSRATMRDTCIKCHDPKNSPKFEFATFLPRMRCPSGN